MTGRDDHALLSRSAGMSKRIPRRYIAGRKRMDRFSRIS